MTRPVSRRVTVYRKDLLPLSETFIVDQFRSYRRWDATLLGQKTIANGLDTSHLPRRTLQRADGLEKVTWKTIQVMDWIHPKMVRTLASLKPDIVHSHFGHDAILVHRAARKLNIPQVVTLHGGDISHRDDYYRRHRDPFMRRYMGRLRKMAESPDVHFIAVSPAIRASAIEKGIPADRVHVRYTGIDLTQFQPSPYPVAARRRKVVFVGRLVRVKGCDVLIQAAAIARASLGDFEIVIIGDGPEKPSLVRLADESGVPATFLGALPRSEVIRHLQEARAFCLPSRVDPNGGYEAFGAVLLEAQASGVPTLTSAHGSKHIAIEEGQTGFSFDAEDAQALSQLLVHLLTDDGLAQRMANRAPIFVKEKFEITSCTSKIESLYEEILSDRRGACRE